MKRAIDHLFTLVNSGIGKLALLLVAVCAPVHVAHAQMVLFSGNNQAGVVTSTLPNPLQVRFSSSSYVTLDWTVTGDATIQESGGATYNQIPGVVVNRGDTYGIHLILGTTPGPVSVNAHCGGCDTGIDITFNETVNGHNSISAVSGDGQSGQGGTTLPTPLTVSFAGTSNATLTWRVTTGNATFQESGSSTFTPLNGTTQTSNGQASSVHLVLGTTPGSVNVTATCSSGCDGATTQSFSATIAPPPTNTMTISAGNNQSGNTATTLPTPLTVQFSGAPVGNSNVNVNWQVTTGNATIQESGSNIYASNFVSTPGSTASIHLVLGNSAGPVGVSATCSVGCTGTTTVTFNETINSAANNISIFAGNNQNGSANSDLGSALQVQFSGTSQATVDWQVTSANAIIKESGSSTYSQTLSTQPGFIDSVHLTLGAANGSVSITATCSSGCSGSTPQSVTFNETIGAGALIKISGDNQTGAVGSPADSPLVIQSGAAGSGISLAGQPVQWTVESGSATLSAAVSQTGTNGQASINFTYGTTPGAVVIRATVGTQFVEFNATSFTANAQIVSGNNQSGVVGTKLQPFTVRILATPAASKGLSQVPVSWTVVQGGGTLTTQTTYTDPTGTSSNTLTLGQNAGTNVVQANIVGIGTLTFTATANPSVTVGSSQFIISAGDHQALVPGKPSQPLVVTLSQTSGQPIIGAIINWTASDSSVKLDSATTFTGSDGTAKNIATVSVPGNYTVTAAVSNAPGITPVTFNLGIGVANVPSLSTPQTGVAQAIDKACPMLAGLPTTNLTPAQRDLLNRCSELVGAAGSNPGQVPDALNQLINNKALPQSQLADSVQLSQFNNLNVRLAELRQGVAGVSAGGLSFVNDGRALALSSLGDLFRKDPKQQADDEVGKDFDRWGFFATGMIERGGFSANNSRPGFDFHNDSLTAGVDYRFNADFVAGIALGYNRNDSTLQANLGKLSADSYSLNGYFTWYHNNDFYVEGSLVLDWLSYDLSRNIAYQITGLSGGMTNVSQQLTSSPDGNQTSFSLSIGKDFSRGAWSISPYLRGVHSHLSLSSFSEAASDPNAPGAGLATSVDSRSMTSSLAVAGARLSYTTSFDWGVLVPNATFEWNHDLKNDPQTVVTRFLADPTQTPIMITDQAPDQNYFNIGVGLNAVLPKGRSAFLLWEHLTGYAGAHENRYSLGIRIEF